MADRQVTRTRKDRNESITSLCNSGQLWSPRYSHDAIRDIESGLHTYYVVHNGKRADVHVVSGSTGKYLRTDWDTTERNNLADLPDC